MVVEMQRVACSRQSRSGEVLHIPGQRASRMHGGQERITDDDDAVQGTGARKRSSEHRIRPCLRPSKAEGGWQVPKRGCPAMLSILGRWKHHNSRISR